jgi:hypothetical protein
MRIWGNVLVGFLVLQTTACKAGSEGDPGCTKDSDCKGERVCVSGACVDPSMPKPEAPHVAPTDPVVVAPRPPVAVAPKPSTLVDEEIAVSTSRPQVRAFTLAASGRVEVRADGVKDTGKGFMLYVMPAEEVANFSQSKDFTHIREYEGKKVASFSHTGTLKAGSWAVVVQNSENLLRTMVVHLQIVRDPAE